MFKLRSSHFRFFVVNFEENLLHINLFQANVSFLHALKTSENQTLPEVLWGYKNGTLTRNVLFVT